MVVLYSISLFLLFLLLYALFAPLVLEIDTRAGMYRFSVSPVFSLRWVPQGYAEVSVFGFRKTISPGKRKPSTVKQRKKRKRKAHVKLKNIRAALRSFRVKKWRVVIDTGDMALNGELYPLFLLLSAVTGRNNRISFTGENEVAITVQNNAFRLLKAFLF